MQKTVRNVDEDLFERVKQVASRKEMNIGEVVNEALLDWLNHQEEPELSIMDFEPMELSEEGEKLSENYRDVIYG